MCCHVKLIGFRQCAFYTTRVTVYRRGGGQVLLESG
jgi:hypothetical protein